MKRKRENTLKIIKTDKKNWQIHKNETNILIVYFIYAKI